MIKATIQNSPYCTEIRFPCSETELSKKLGEIKMNPENLAPMATVIEIEPAELSMLTDCDVSLDALNYLGKRLDGMDESEHKQYLAALSCPEISEGWGLKNIINLTYNLARYTLIEDTDDLERIGLIHMLNVRGGLSESEYNNSEWLAEEGMKLLESGKGIDTEYGKIFVNDEIPLPCSSAIVANVCLRSWKRTFLQPARSKISCNRFLTDDGFLGLLLSNGDGNIHSDSTDFLYSASIFTSDTGSITVRTDAFVFGTDIITSALIIYTCRSMRSSPVEKLRSLHLRASISPQRIPVPSSNKNSS